MRRFVRPLVIALATLGLALGVSVGLAAPALADTSFTATVSNGPILNTTGEIDFYGQKAAGSTISAARINIAGDISSCVGSGGTGTNWSCEFDPSAPMPTGNFAAQFVETDADGTQTTQVLSFVIYVYTDPAATAQPTSPIVGYQFAPGGVTVIGTPAGAASDTVGTQILDGADDYTAVDPTCPAGVDPSHPLGNPAVPATSVTCTDSSLTDNSNVVAEVQQGDSGTGVASPDTSNGLVHVPENSIGFDGPPVAISSDTASRTVTITGTVASDELPGDEIVVFDNGGGIVCRTSTSVPAGRYDTWSCTTSALSLGTHVLTVALEDDGQLVDTQVADELDAAGLAYGYYVPGGISSAVVAGTVTFSVPSVPAGGGSLGDVTPNWSFSIGGDLSNVHPGDTLTITGSGLPGATVLDTILHSTPTDLGQVVAAADGTFSQTVTVPSDVELGDHTVMVTASGPGITTTTKQQAITVTAPSTSVSPGKNSSGLETTKPTATHGIGGSTKGAAIDPNILTRALSPIADVAVHPNKIVSALEIGLVLLLLAVLPAHLLNATISEQSDRFERRFGRARMPAWLVRLGAWFRSAPFTGGVVVTLIAAILFGFADPKFGFTLASLRLVLACGIALFLVGYVANALTGVIARVQWNVVTMVSTRPYGLVLTLVGVIVSRFLHFSPGFLIGLILGLTIQGKSSAGFAWRTVVVRTSIVLIMAIAAWIGYSTLTLGGNEGGTFGSALLVETLVAITTEGVVALLVELLPLRFLEGERVYEHSRVLWGALYVFTLVVFVLAVIPWEGNWDALHGALWIWIVVLAVFAALCIGVYIYFRRFAPAFEEEAGDEEVPLGETVGHDR